MNKKGESTVAWVVAIALVVLVYLFYTGMQTPQAIPSPGAGVPGCSDSGITMTVGPLEVKDSPGTSVAGVKSVTYINGKLSGGPAGRLDSSTLTVGAGDKVKIGYNVNSTAAKNGAADFYGAIIEGTAPCKAFNTNEFADGSKYQLYRNSSLTISVFDWQNPGTLVSAGTAATAMQAGDVKDFPVQIIGDAFKAYSPYGDLVVSLQMNATTAKKLSITGDGWSEATCPSSATDALVAASTGRWCVKHAGIIGGQTVDGKLRVEIQSSGVDVTSAMQAAAANNITVRVYDQDYFVDSISNELKGPAVENDANSQVGFPVYTTTNLIGLQ